jgi:ABC-type amino acid transport substrate-binding protein
MADAALTDTTTARQYIAGHRALGIGPRQTSDPYVIAVRMAAPELFRALDRALAQIKADGTLEHIVEQWLDH